MVHPATTLEIVIDQYSSFDREHAGFESCFHEFATGPRLSDLSRNRIYRYVTLPGVFAAADSTPAISPVLATGADKRCWYRAHPRTDP
jgi:hypothetical protein